jgi:hypothetical protein
MQKSDWAYKTTTDGNIKTLLANHIYETLE